MTEKQKTYPAPLNYHGFPKSICTSINHIICHGIPAKENATGFNGKAKPAILKDGDILNIDITVIVPDDENASLDSRPKGYHGDTSKMFLVGNVSPADRRLCTIAQESLYAAMHKIKPGIQVGEIGVIIEKYIKSATPRCSIVKDFCGHGIGSDFHEEPQVVHYKAKGATFDKRILKPGMIFTVEPMINAGKFGCTIDKEDDWTVYTGDGKNSAQWEHTILVTDTGCEVLTLRREEKIPRHMKNT